MKFTQTTEYDGEIKPYIDMLKKVWISDCGYYFITKERVMSIWYNCHYAKKKGVFDGSVEIDVTQDFDHARRVCVKDDHIKFLNQI